MALGRLAAQRAARECHQLVDAQPIGGMLITQPMTPSGNACSPAPTDVGQSDLFPSRHRAQCQDNGCVGQGGREGVSITGERCGLLEGAWTHDTGCRMDARCDQAVPDAAQCQESCHCDRPAAAAPRRLLPLTISVLVPLPLEGLGVGGAAVVAAAARRGESMWRVAEEGEARASPPLSARGTHRPARCHAAPHLFASPLHHALDAHLCRP